MIALIWFLLHLRVTFKKLYRQLTFQDPHQFRNRQLRWYRHNKMNVVTFHTHFLNLTFIYNMGQFLVLTHVTNMGTAEITLPPTKEVDF